MSYQPSADYAETKMNYATLPENNLLQHATIKQFSNTHKIC